MNSESLSQKCLILTPRGRDAEIASDMLRQAGLSSLVVGNLAELQQNLGDDAYLALISSEVIQTADLRTLSTFLERQPAWSDFPFIILTARSLGPDKSPVAARMADVLGNVSFLERPFHPTTFLSLIKTAIRSRSRQYEARARQLDLAESEERLQTALVAGGMGAWRLDVIHKALFASAKCKSHFGRGVDDSFSYEDLHRSVHPDDVERMQSAVAHTLTTGQDYVIEYKNLWSDGSVHWVDVRARAIRNEAGEIWQLVGVSSDITERKVADIERENLLERLAQEQDALSRLTEDLEDRVRERTEQLVAETANREKAQQQLFQSQKLESIGQLTGGVAHDFNNLLAAIIGNLDLLKKRVPDDPRVQRLVDGAMQGAQRGASLTQRLLAFARQQDLKTSSVDVALLLSGFKDLIQHSLGVNFTLTVQTTSNPPPIQIDAVQVELAVLNLAINARDAMPDGGSINIEAAPSPPAHDGHRYVIISVTDTGMGMDVETLQKATEPFFSTKPLGKGTGLGLSMVHGLAIQLGGRFEIKSVVGQGTRAELWLPIAEHPVQESKSDTKEITVASKQATILVVDDDPLISMSTVEMLEDLGHVVIEVSSGKQALEILQERSTIDLLITDQSMPGMTGVQLAEKVRELYPRLPILIATGYADLPGGIPFDLPKLSKPYRQIELKEQLDRLL